MAHYFPYDVKLRLLAHSRSFLANQKARNAIVGAENLLKIHIHSFIHSSSLRLLSSLFRLRALIKGNLSNVDDDDAEDDAK